MLPLENRLIFKGFILLEVALQQALEGAAVAGLVLRHLISHVAALVTKRKTIHRSFSTVSLVLKL